MSFDMSLPRLIIQCNFATIVTCILLATFIFTNTSFTKKVSARFLSICFSTLFLTLSDNIRFITAHLPEPNIWRYLSASAGYTIRPLIIFLLATLAGRRSKTKLRFWITIPLYINGLISFLSCLPPTRGIMFNFDAQNNFIRGPFGILPYICCALYLTLILYYIIKKTVIIPSEITIIVVVMVLGAVATLMESQFKYDLILSQVMFIGTVFYYLFFNVQVYKRDTLTQLENRRCFYLQLDKLEKNEFCIISMDLNNLKIYNDTKGHAYGDEVLITCTEIMRKSFPKKCKLYRTGGDEFMAILKNCTLEQSKELIKKFQDNLSQTIYKVACGASVYHPGDNFDKVIAVSDMAMYENKRLLKGTIDD